jgi:hypothetical protein
VSTPANAAPDPNGSDGRGDKPGPYNEPLVSDVDPRCWLDTDEVEQAQALIAGLDHEWRPREPPEHSSPVSAAGERP